ncbi:hypothetical protein BKA56DRAFT_597562 [Ilyonectria sp. MPI-CAGE-AT-0026]|nr:hypothetical protein BKA56DRAFT_597562 [Ilyonectria sp. MPI-CAGE-AT-0026]
MRILVVGGAGMIGGHAALYLQSKGHEVTIAGRRRPESVPVLAALPFLKGNYLANNLISDQLTWFQAVVLTAGADGVAKLSTPTFSAYSLDPSFVVDTVPSMKIPMFEAYV